MVGDNIGTGTILDEDTALLSISDVNIVEGNYVQRDAVFTVTLSTPSSFVVSMDYISINGTATSGLDYQSRSGVVSIAPGSLQQFINVPVYGDLIDEIDETFQLGLSNPINSNFINSTAIATIIDDDPLSELGINSIYLPEPTSGTYPAVFTVSLSPSSGKTVTATYATTDGTAISGVDFLPTSGMLTFNPGIQQQAITVTVNSDLFDENNETFFVNLQDVGGAQI